jgi:hypothetical protein
VDFNEQRLPYLCGFSAYLRPTESDYESEGRRFESCRARRFYHNAYHNPERVHGVLRVFNGTLLIAMLTIGAIVNLNRLGDKTNQLDKDTVLSDHGCASGSSVLGHTPSSEATRFGASTDEVFYL